MLTHHGKSWTVFLGILFLLLFSSLSLAQEGDPPPPNEQTPSLEEWRELVKEALPPVITANNIELVTLLLSPVLGEPLKKTFDPAIAIRKLFGDKDVTVSPDCDQVRTPVGDIDAGECRVFWGKPSGQKAYRELRFSKQMAFGNISWLHRKYAIKIDPAELKPITITDEEAYRTAVKFLNSTFGLTLKEIPQAPAGAEYPFPVKTIALGWGGRQDRGGAVPVEKIVMIQRGLEVNADKNLVWVPGPGRAMVIMDDARIKEAMIRGWQKVLPHPNADPKMAKTDSDIIDEIATDMAAYSKGPVSTINFRILLSAVPSTTGVGLLLPAIQVAVSPVPDDLSEDEQAKVWTTAGFIREYSLVRLPEKSDGLNGNDL